MMMRKTWMAAAALMMAGTVMSAVPGPAAAQANPAGGVESFYRARGNAPLWFASGNATAANQLMQLLATAQIEGVNPKRYNLRAVQRAAAQGGPQAERVLSQAFVAYVRDTRRDPNVGVIYVDPELRPAAPSPAAILAAAAAAPSLSQYVSELGWQNPIYGRLRLALTSRLYRSEAERRLLALNLERARALPTGGHRYIIVNAAAQRLYMYEDGKVVDSMRVVAGKPEPSHQTPMMNAFIRYVALNPYWNVPPETASHNLAPKALKQGRSYFQEKGYQVLSDWSDNARVVDPMSVDWRAVADGRLQVRMRQKPGPANSMGKMKFMFPNKQGIWLHDTPVQEKIDEAARLQSSGCVRLEDAARLARWMFGRPVAPKGSAPEQKLNLPQKMPIYLTYLTAVPSGTQIVYFDDHYGKDRGQVRRRG